MVGNRKIHTYAASFGNDLAQQLIAENTDSGDIILDPFSGAATSVAQARSLGRSAIGIDIDPIACLIAKVITSDYSDKEVHNFLQLGEEKIKNASLLAREILYLDSVLAPGSQFCVNGYKPYIPLNTKISYWFSPVQRAILAALIEIFSGLEIEKLRAVAYLAISASIIHKWPNTLSLAKDIDHSRPHRTEREHLSVDDQILIFQRSFNNIIRKMKEICKQTSRTSVYYKIIEGDACEELNLLDADFVDYVLTSPPYFNAIDYPRAHKFSQWWLWPDREQVHNELYIGLKNGGRVKDNENVSIVSKIIPESMPAIIPISEISISTFTKLCRYTLDLDIVIKGLRHVMKTDGLLNLIIANNVVRNIQIPIVTIIQELLKTNGFGDIKLVKREIAGNRRRYPYGIRGFQGLMTTEYIIYAKKS